MAVGAVRSHDQLQWDDLIVALETIVVPSLFMKKGANETIRIWLPDCGSGELAYAVAALFYAYAERQENPPLIQIFATNNDADALSVARAGYYGESLTSILPPEYVERFFLIFDNKQYEVKPMLRDVITFAQHFVLRDPPFSRLDLVVCRLLLSSRSLLSENERELILYDFHWALKQQSYLIAHIDIEYWQFSHLFARDSTILSVFQRQMLSTINRTAPPYRPYRDVYVVDESLEAANERLIQMNILLRRNIGELTQANNDLNNLVSATDLAIIFLDNLLQITRFTPQARTLFNLIYTDRGRPLKHIKHNLHYTTLLDDAANVIMSGQGIEHEAESLQGRWYLVHLRPYRINNEGIAGVVLICVDITARRLAETELRAARDELELRVRERTEELTTANAQLQAEITQRILLEQERTDLLRKLVTTLEDERRRIARELHDQLGQSITALNVGMGFLATPTITDEQRKETLARLQQITAQIDHDMDRLALDLRPMALDDLGLAEALQQHIDQWGEQSGIRVEFELIEHETERLPAPIESVIFRVIQEALTNVVKHAAAHNVSVILERRRDLVRVIVEDDGQGFDLEGLQQQPNNGRLGLLGMRERVALVNGTLTFETEPGTGTTLFALIPVSANTSNSVMER